ncbi:putative baseplate wedge protein [Serratia phage vB_SmaM_Yaphecito]|uniref:Putative baseplate wedge protein n=1 Tax=Serratia phage vB_SmaM_Yaphecito TaxID=2777368 RepID=A0A7T3NBL9_9CAUD|nr:putative baseplate wedge protein [Serratia phage vB_SmaM_Yaphecito]
MADYDLEAKLRAAPWNPASFQRVGLEFLASKLDGDVLTDVNSPVVHLLEVSATQAVEHINVSLANDRRHYPLLANNFADLYGHMSDADYLERFGSPGKVTLMYYVAYDEVIRAMKVIPNTEVKRVIIPRYTQITPSGTPLTLLYPLEIRQLPHGGIQVSYNTDATSPIQTLTDNMLKWEMINDPQGTKYMLIYIPVYQLERSVTLEQVMDVRTRFAIPFNDQYFYTRCFFGQEGNWTEMSTTHSLQVYDENNPTAILQVAEGFINLTIPPIYLTNRSITGTLRVDVYSTKGDIVQDLSNFASETFGVVWGDDMDVPSLNGYSAAVPNLSYVFVSDDTIRGGMNGLTFEEQRERVINNATKISIPITPAQIEAKLNRAGFDILKSRDDITERLYLATSSMAVPDNSPFSSGIATAISTLQTSMTELAGLQGVYDNGDRITLSPRVLYSFENGVLKTVADNARPEVINKTPESLINAVNGGSYVYSPFHYVLDATNNNFALRPYYLANPSIIRRSFIRDNASAGISLTTKEFAIARFDGGYRLTVKTTVDDKYLAIDPANRYLQLAFVPPGESDYAYLNGTYAGVINKDVIWTFEIKTDFDIDREDRLIVTNFAMYEATPREFPLPLEQEFTLINVVTDYSPPGLQQTAIDLIVGKFLVGKDPVGLMEERVTLELGKSLDNLWAGSRVLAGSYVYQTYATNVYQFYDEDVPEMNPDGTAKYEIVNGEFKLILQHKAGDPVLDKDGQQVIKFKAGDPVLDANGQPVPVSARPTIRLIDIFVMDGNYYYADGASEKSDAAFLPNSVVNDILPRLDEVARGRLEQTNISFFPKQSLGSVEVIVDDGQSQFISGSLSFKTKVLLTDIAWRDTKYREELRKSISRIINTELRKETVSTMNIISAFKDQRDENVRGFEMSIMSNGREVNTFTAVDQSVQPTVRRLLEYAGDGTYQVREDIAIDWRDHTGRRYN